MQAAAVPSNDVPVFVSFEQPGTGAALLMSLPSGTGLPWGAALFLPGQDFSAVNIFYKTIGNIFHQCLVNFTGYPEKVPIYLRKIKCLK